MTDEANADDYLERVKDEIRVDADRARQRAPLPRIDPATFDAQPAARADGIERERIDYAVNELTGAHYLAFVDQAFRALLKRAPDEVGHAVQLKLLTGGAAKAEILGNLRWSPEGRHVGAHVRGLLPRYVLAKAARLPVIGYAIDWAMALAALPLLMRHQRAADTSATARFDQLGDLQKQTRALHDQLQTDHTQTRADHQRAFENVRVQLGELSAHTTAIDAQIARATSERSAASRELAELRHHVHVANHWVTSLQRSLDILERDAESVAGESSAVAVDQPTGADELTHAQSHTAWAAELAQRLPAGAQVFDLGCGDGDWLAALAAAGVDGIGVDADAARIARARSRKLDVALGDPGASLVRIADGSLAALSIDARIANDGNAVIALLHDATRALEDGGILVVRVQTASLASSCRSGDASVSEWRAAFARAGFADVQLRAYGDDTALFAGRA